MSKTGTYLRIASMSKIRKLVHIVPNMSKVQTYDVEDLEIQRQESKGIAHINGLLCYVVVYINIDVGIDINDGPF